LWCWRSYVHHGVFSISTSVGQNLWIGIQEETEGTANLAGKLSYYALLSTQEMEQITALNPSKQNEHFINKYKAELKANPTVFFKMYLVKLKNFWWFRSGIGGQRDGDYTASIGLYKMAYAVMLLLALGMTYFFREVLVLLSFPLALSLTQSVFYVETRHRIMIEPILIIIIVVGIGLWIHKKSAGGVKRAQP